ncbi:MAG: sulfide/dihydroorotate dehydrogenase-like FAD/NAD-binding protein [Nitrospiraceae bacterium]|nr:sulfide/dihydroorotate dehydrogenase-like FAD/NAD-binding protein [Nitrospiraceae bacterium]MDA8431614.1 sulfide/dihydroorotate dehydrogenase-like FAD/NAD-binding protein [Nitrospiraceae bacterium]
MAKILEKRLVRFPDIYYYRLDAPLIARKAKPGQFVIIRLNKEGERIPLSLADINPQEGTISLMVMSVGKTTSEMSTITEGEDILDVCGPLGQPTHIEKVGKAILVGGGFGVAPLFPIAKAFKAKGNEVTAVLGARNKDLLIYEKEMRSVCDEVLITTDDGSKGVKGVVTDALKQKLEQHAADIIVAIGPPVMMKFVSRTSEPFGVKTIVSLNPIMIDGTGMCGGCRVQVAGKTRFACTDGPDFDGHEVDWEVLMNRQKAYVTDEKKSFEEWKKRHEDAICQ